jgi:hypothetical protein
MKVKFIVLNKVWTLRHVLLEDPASGSTKRFTAYARYC